MNVATFWDIVPCSPYVNIHNYCCYCLVMAHVFHCYMHSHWHRMCRKHHSSVAVHRLRPSKGWLLWLHNSCSEWICHTAPFLRLLIQSNLQVNLPFFFSEGMYLWHQPCFPSMWLSFHSDYFTTAPRAPSLMLLISSGSLISCELVQVYHHNLGSGFSLNPVYHIILVTTFNGTSHVDGAWATSLHAGWATEEHSVIFLVAWRTGQAVVLSFHPVTDQLHNCGCRVYGALSLSCDWLWAIPCCGVPNSRS